MVYVIAKDGTPLMPTERHGKVKWLLRKKKAKVESACPFTIRLLYEPETDGKGQPVTLDGANVKTADNIICIADMTAEQAESLRVADIESGEYVHVTVPFEQRQPFDVDKQINGKYNIALVFSSSANGAAFEGAVGSTLYVDEVEIVTK